MAGVPQKTLNWLYDVLKREYHDPNRTYSDLAQTLAQHPGFAPRTDVYTSENGVPALLLNLKGTLPVNFRGTVYRFPIAIWVPHAYPYEAPIVYVTPAEDMVVRPGQHVSASDGKVYHHYLARWKESWDRSNLVEFLRVLADIFSREAPVMARPSQQTPLPQQQQQQRGFPPPVPPPPSPQDSRRPSGQPPLPASTGRTEAPSQRGPPLPPPKQAAYTTRPGSTGPPPPAPKPSRYDAPPPLPGQTLPTSSSPSQQPYRNGGAVQPPVNAQYMPQRASSLRQQYPPQEQPLVPQQYQAQSPARPLPEQRPTTQSPDHTRNISSPQPVPYNYSQPYQPGPAHPSAYQPQPGQQEPSRQVQAQAQAFPQAAHSQQQPPPQMPQQYQPHQHPRRQHQPTPQAPIPQPQPQPHQPKAAPPQKDLLTEDDPFQITLTANAQNPPPAPPIPTNPEKTALLSHLSHLILQRLHSSIQQTQTSALPSLYSQHSALTAASQTLTSELHQLQSLSQQLQSNISALQTTINQANNTIKSTQDPKHASHPDNIPAIDQIIIPPTVVARQLYDAVAEQRGYESAIFALNEAFVRGRIGAEIWGRKVRECAREEMRRKWLVRKIGEGLGLEEH